MTDIYTLNKLDSIEAEAIRGSAAQKGIYVTPNLIRRFKGDGNTAIIFKRFLYCCEQWADEEGWFYQTADTIERVVGLGYTALQRSVKRLESMGLIEKKLAGMPYKTHYRVNLSAYLELIKQAPSSGTSAKTRLDTSVEASPDISDETCPDTSSQQVILSDTDSNDTESDTYAADADFSPSPETPAADDHPEDEPFDAGTEKMWEQYREAEANQKAGGNYAVPPTAGGDDGLADAALFALYSFRGKKPAKKGSREWQNQCSRVAEALKAYGYERASLELVEKAAEIHCERKGDWTNVFYPSFAMDFGQALSDAEHFIKHGRLPDDGNRKGAKHGPRKRHIADGAVKRQVATEDEARAILG
jgi:hypothetical protein